MNIEFHYWITLFILRRAKLPAAEARIIAQASQLTDERTRVIPVIGSKGQDMIPASQSYSISKEADELRLAFHFIPGEPNKITPQRLDGRSHPLVVSPNSPEVKRLLVAALKTGNPYRIGIALHAYADSWAHAGFTATLDPFNAFYPDDPIPAIGHAVALRRPDLLYENWLDPRLKAQYSQVRNRERFMQAARQCYKYLATYMRRSYDDVDLVEAELNEIWGFKHLKAKAERYSDYALVLHEGDYEPDEWFKTVGLSSQAATATHNADGFSQFSGQLRKLARRGGELLFGELPTDPVTISDDFYRSHLYHWSQAANEHRRLAAGDRTGAPTTSN